MTALADIAAKVRPHGLAVMGHCPPAPDDGLPADVGTVVLVGPDGGRMWPLFAASPEQADGAPDPLDRWSKRVIRPLAGPLGAVFPSDGPPYPPFVGWALRSGRAHLSPVNLLVHDVAGLMVSYRGAILLAERIAPQARPSPCGTCPGRPCLSACPAGAMTADGYGIAACKDYIRSDAADCLDRGCRVRRACPLSQAGGRPEAQSAFHMRAFL